MIGTVGKPCTPLPNRLVGTSYPSCLSPTLLFGKCSRFGSLYFVLASLKVWHCSSFSYRRFIRFTRCREELIRAWWRASSHSWHPSTWRSWRWRSCCQWLDGWRRRPWGRPSPGKQWTRGNCLIVLFWKTHACIVKIISENTMRVFKQYTNNWIVTCWTIDSGNVPS